MRKGLINSIVLLILGLASVYGQERKIGDVITNSDGSRGVVFWVSPDGKKGWMIAMHDLSPKASWCQPGGNVPDLDDTGDIGFNTLLKALTDTAGYANTAKIRAYLGPGRSYAAQLVDFENGWYLPAAGQLKKLYAVCPFINSVITRNGGSELHSVGNTLPDYSYFTSTESSKQYAWCCLFTNGWLGVSEKTNIFYARAVRTFYTDVIPRDTSLTYVWNTGKTGPFVTEKPSETTTYSVEATSIMGCSATAAREIFVAGGRDTTYYDTICRGEIYTKNGFNVSETGSYTRTLEGPGGCRVTVRLELKVNEPEETLILDTVCEGSVYTKHNFSVWDPGEYIQRWTGSNGCDSVVILQLAVNPAYHEVIRASVCSGESYASDGFNVSEAGTYERRLQTQAGCDSIFTLELSVWPVRHRTIEAEICKGEIYEKYGFRESEAGVYEKPLLGVTGCDSLVTLRLNVLPVSEERIEAEICEGDTYTQHGFHVSTPGDHTLRLQNVFGCDSIVNLHLSVYPNYNDTIRAALCQGEIYTEQGFHVSETGIYTRTLTSSRGCDSLVTLELAVRPIYRDTVTVGICRGEVYTGYGLHTGEPGYYDRPMTSVSGCDSLITVHLEVFPVYRDTIYASICTGETYKENGFSASVAGCYDRPLTTVSGCDSLVTLVLTVSPVYQDTLRAAICAGEIYAENGFRVSEAGYYEKTYSSVSGCDSVVSLFLTVYPIYRDTVRAEICEGDTYVGYGFSVSQPGYHDRLMRSISGCDSLLTLDLTVHPAYHEIITAEICEGKVYDKYGFRESKTGTYERAFRTIWGCDSIFTLVLQVNPVPHDTIRAAICRGEVYSGNGFQVSEPGMHHLAFPVEGKCDSLVTLSLTVHPSYLLASRADICEGDSYAFRGKSYRESGRYEERLVTSKGCDSLYRLDLTVRPVYRKTVETTICEGEYYVGEGFYVRDEGEYVHHYYSRYGCDSIITLQLKVADYFRGKLQSSLEDCRTHAYRFSVIGENPEPDPEESYIWDFGDGENSVFGEVLHEFRDSGTYRIKLWVTRGGKCRDSLEYRQTVPYFSEEFEIHAFPEALDEDLNKITFRTVCRGDMVYEWDFGDGKGADACQTVHKYELDGREYYEVRLRVRNEDDCPVERALRLPVYHKVNVPNTFSPNGDAINDFFMPGYQVRIINRAGVEIYKGEDGWDGTYKGEQVAEDTYFYELNYPTALGMKTKKGYITVAR